jgi:hypothetical protein
MCVAPRSPRAQRTPVKSRGAIRHAFAPPPLLLQLSGRADEREGEWLDPPRRVAAASPRDGRAGATGARAIGRRSRTWENERARSRCTFRVVRSALHPYTGAQGLRAAAQIIRAIRANLHPLPSRPPAPGRARRMRMPALNACRTDQQREPWGGEGGTKEKWPPFALRGREQTTQTPTSAQELGK